MKRWTKSARWDKVISDDGLEIEDCFHNSFLMIHMTLFRLASNVIENGIINEEASKILMDDFENWLQKIKLVVGHDAEAVEKNKCTEQFLLKHNSVETGKKKQKRRQNRKSLGGG